MDKLAVLLKAVDAHVENLIKDVIKNPGPAVDNFYVVRQFGQKKVYIQVNGPMVGWTSKEHATLLGKADAAAIAKQKGGTVQKA